MVAQYYWQSTENLRVVSCSLCVPQTPLTSCPVTGGCCNSCAHSVHSLLLSTVSIIKQSKNFFLLLLQCLQTSKGMQMPSQPQWRAWWGSKHTKCSEGQRKREKWALVYSVCAYTHIHTRTYLHFTWGVSMVLRIIFETPLHCKSAELCDSVTSISIDLLPTLREAL